VPVFGIRTSLDDNYGLLSDRLLETRDPDTVERAMKEHLTAARERALGALASR